MDFKFLDYIESLYPYWGLAMNDLLQDPQGCFFVDDNDYTDIALYLVKYMSEYVPLN